jgi:hypothetical protein
MTAARTAAFRDVVVLRTAASAGVSAVHTMPVRKQQMIVMTLTRHSADAFTLLNHVFRLLPISALTFVFPSLPSGRC